MRYIAIADDHAMFRKTLAVLINLFADYKVLFDAPNGKDFISQLNPEKLPDIALLDINMPVMDGCATAAWLQQHYPEIKVLVLSTMEDETSIIKMIRCGAKGYVLKDADPAELKHSFNEVFSNEFYHNEPGAVSMPGRTGGTAIESAIELSGQEAAFLQYAATEAPYKDIAAKMNMSMQALDTLRESVFSKLGVKTRVGLAIYAVQHHLV